jgi:hypothetical protein
VLGAWTPPAAPRVETASCGEGQGVGELAAAAGLTAWSYVNGTRTVLRAAVPGAAAVTVAAADGARGERLGNLAGDGRLLVFQTWRDEGREVRLWRVAGARPAARLLRAGDDTFAVAAVDDGLIAAREPGGRVRVLDARGRLLHALPAVAAEDAGVALDGARVAVARGSALSIFDARTDELLGRRRLASAAGPPRLHDVARGLAAYATGLELHLLRLADGRDRIVDLPGAVGPVEARFGEQGLFVSYNRAYDRRPGRLVLFPWSSLR